MKLIKIFTILFFLLPRAGYGVWVEQPPIEKGIGVIYDGFQGNVRGENNLYITTQYDLKEYSFYGSSWSISETISLGSEGRAVAYGTARNDGTSRIYTGTSGGDIFEYYHTGASWVKRNVHTFSHSVNSLIVEKGFDSGLYYIWAVTSDGKVWSLFFVENDWYVKEIGSTGLTATDIVRGNDSLYVTSHDGCIYQFKFNGGIFDKNKLYKTHGYLKSVAYYISNENIEYVVAVSKNSNIYCVAKKDGVWHSFEIYPGKGSLHSIEVIGDKFYIAGANGNILIYGLKNRKLALEEEITFSGTLYWAIYDSYSDRVIAGGSRGNVFNAAKMALPPGDVSHIPDNDRSPLFPFPTEDVRITVSNKSEGLEKITLYYSTEGATAYQSLDITNNHSGVIPAIYSIGTIINYYIKFEYSTISDTYLYSGKRPSRKLLLSKKVFMKVLQGISHLSIW